MDEKIIYIMHKWNSVEFLNYQKFKHFFGGNIKCCGSDLLDWNWMNYFSITQTNNQFINMVVENECETTISTCCVCVINLFEVGEKNFISLFLLCSWAFHRQTSNKLCEFGHIAI